MNLQIRKHICTLLFQKRDFTRKRYSVSERVKKTRHFSDDSSEHLWLVIAFISSTASCVIGYNAQRCKQRLYLAQRQLANADLNLAADDMTRWTM